MSQVVIIDMNISREKIADIIKNAGSIGVCIGLLEKTWVNILFRLGRPI